MRTPSKFSNEKTDKYKCYDFNGWLNNHKAKQN